MSYDDDSPEIPMLAADNATEMARLMNLHHVLAREMGGLFPKHVDLSNVHHVLDLACGSGGWVLDAAFEYPKVDVTGLDISPAMVKYAFALAQAQGLQNAHFKVMDVLKPLNFPDHTFDLVNARCLGPYVPTRAWPALLHECMRILRPGGLLCLTEAEMPITNSNIFEEVSRLFTEIIYRTECGFSTSGQHLAVTPMLNCFLRLADCQKIQHTASAIDFSKGEESYEDCYDNFTIVLQLLEPFLLKTEMLTKEKFDDLYRELSIAMLTDGFCAIWYWLTAWGEKPREPT